MRLWSLHPSHLDRAGLVAVWREGLLAQAVIAGRTRGFRHHPQLERFRASPDPLGAIGRYLAAVADEAERRGYRFDRSKIDRVGDLTLTVTDGQVRHELAHLSAKLARRAPDRLSRLDGAVHPLFRVVPGPVEAWERRQDQEG